MLMGVAATIMIITPKKAANILKRARMFGEKMFWSGMFWCVGVLVSMFYESCFE